MAGPTGNHNLKRVTVLSGVGGYCCRDRDAPDDEFDVGEGWRLEAALCVRVQSRISFKVEVECNTSKLLIAKLRTLVGVIAVEIGIAHIRRSRR